MASCLATSEAYTGQGTCLPVHQIGMRVYHGQSLDHIANSVATGYYRHLSGS
jgi:hypothetical protein